MSDPRLARWDRELETGLPDARLRYSDRERATVWIGNMEWQKVFCVNCGANGGAVPPTCPHVFYLCERCARLNGPPPGCLEIKQG